MHGRSGGEFVGLFLAKCPIAAFAPAQRRTPFFSTRREAVILDNDEDRRRLDMSDRQLRTAMTFACGVHLAYTYLAPLAPYGAKQST